MEFSDEQWKVTVLDDSAKPEIHEFVELLMSGQIKYKNCTT